MILTDSSHCSALVELARTNTRALYCAFRCDDVDDIVFPTVLPVLFFLFSVDYSLFFLIHSHLFYISSVHPLILVLLSSGPSSSTARPIQPSPQLFLFSLFSFFFLFFSSPSLSFSCSSPLRVVFFPFFLFFRSCLVSFNFLSTSTLRERKKISPAGEKKSLGCRLSLAVTLHLPSSSLSC